MKKKKQINISQKMKIIKKISKIIIKKIKTMNIFKKINIFLKQMMKKLKI